MNIFRDSKTHKTKLNLELSPKKGNGFGIQQNPLPDAINMRILFGWIEIKRIRLWVKKRWVLAHRLEIQTRVLSLTFSYFPIIHLL